MIFKAAQLSLVRVKLVQVDLYHVSLSAKISALKMSLLMFAKLDRKTMNNKGKRKTQSENSNIKLFHFSVIRAQRIHEAKLASIAVRKNRNT